MSRCTKPDVSNLRAICCPCYSHVPKSQRTKWQATSKQCILVGYNEDNKSYRLFDKETKKIIISRDVTFDEKALSEKTISFSFENIPYASTSASDSQSHTEETVNEGVDADSEVAEETLQKNISDEEDESRVLQWKRAVPSTSKRQTQKHIDKNNILPERTRNKIRANIAPTYSTPTTYEEAINSENSDQWIEAMDNEIHSLTNIDNCWTLEPVPQHITPISNKWIYRLKHNSDGSVKRYKARLVVRGCFQEEGINFSETYSPVARFESIRLLIALSVTNNFYLGQFDVSTAFLYAKLSETVYMNQPKGY